MLFPAGPCVAAAAPRHGVAAPKGKPGAVPEGACERSRGKVIVKLVLFCLSSRSLFRASSCRCGAQPRAVNTTMLGAVYGFLYELWPHSCASGYGLDSDRVFFTLLISAAHSVTFWGAW